jgi:Holliday junction resolvasome RuvABC endonuclease subunit
MSPGIVKVAGIDPSLAGFVIGIGSCSAAGEPAVQLHRIAPRPPARTLVGRIARYESMATETLTLLRREQPELVLIEGYAFGAKGSAVVTLGELGALVRHALLVDFAGRVVEVSPSMAKRAACGRGNASKVEIASALASRHRVTFRDDDEADAWGLARIALCAIGAVDGHVAFEREVAAELRRLLRCEQGLEEPTSAKTRKRKREPAAA